MNLQVEQIRELEYQVGKVPDGRRKRKKESENKIKMWKIYIELSDLEIRCPRGE